MQNEVLLTEFVRLNLVHQDSSTSYIFPAIQKYLDEGYVVKNIFYSPSLQAGHINGIALTVHLQKQ